MNAKIYNAVFYVPILALRNFFRVDRLSAFRHKINDYALMDEIIR